jgi:hypothetical protein
MQWPAIILLASSASCFLILAFIRSNGVEDRPDQFSDADTRPASLLNSPDHAPELGHG